MIGALALPGSAEASPKAVRTALSVMATALVLALGAITQSAWAQDEVSRTDLNALLAKMSTELNKSFPQMADEFTRIDRTAAGDLEFTYYYTVIKSPVAGADPGYIRAVLEEMSSGLAKPLCANSVWKRYLDWGVRVNYSYVGPDGKPVANFLVTASDCKK